MQRIGFCATVVLMLAASVGMACNDAVVLVHGNTGAPTDWDNTYSELLSRGYSAGEIERPVWGSSCAACNNHSGSEEVPVLNAMVEALAVSCTGKIDVIGHSMGATLAAWQIVENGLVNDVNTFVGVAGAFRGLWSCGTYPWSVWTPTCGYWGLSVSSPFLDALGGEPLGNRVYSIKSYADQVVCATGTCTVGGIHSSRISGEDGTYTFAYGHFGLQAFTAESPPPFGHLPFSLAFQGEGCQQALENRPPPWNVVRRGSQRGIVLPLGVARRGS